MSVDRNKAIVRRLFEVWNTGKLDTIEELYAADYVADYRPYAPLRHGHDRLKVWCSAPMSPFLTTTKSWKRWKR
jgi:ketosteroid isomerase-like protein